MALKYGGEELVRPDAQEPLPVLSEDLVEMVEGILKEDSQGEEGRPDREDSEMIRPWFGPIVTEGSFNNRELYISKEGKEQLYKQLLSLLTYYRVGSSIKEVEERLKSDPVVKMRIIQIDDHYRGDLAVAAPSPIKTSEIKEWDVRKGFKVVFEQRAADFSRGDIYVAYSSSDMQPYGFRIEINNGQLAVYVIALKTAKDWYISGRLYKALALMAKYNNNKIGLQYDFKDRKGLEALKRIGEDIGGENPPRPYLDRDVFFDNPWKGEVNNFIIRLK
jgi:hypothetical protein